MSKRSAGRIGFAVMGGRGLCRALAAGALALSLCPPAGAQQAAAGQPDGAAEATLSLAAPDPLSLLDAAQPVAFIVRGKNLLDEPLTADVFWEATDVRGKRVARGQAALKLSAGGSEEQRIEVPLTRAGCYRITATVRRPGAWEQLESVPLRLLRARGGTTPSPDKPLYGDPDYAEPGAEPPPAPAADVPPPAPEFGWLDVEKARGEYTFSPGADAWIAAARDLGLRCLPISIEHNPVYGEPPFGPEEIAAFADYCAAVAKRWGGEKGIRAWELRPTPAARQMLAATPARWAALFDAARRAFREADGQAVVAWSMPLGRDRGPELAALALSAVRPPDAFAAMPAAGPLPAEEMATDLRRLRADLDRAGMRGRPLWLAGLPPAPGRANAGSGAIASGLAPRPADTDADAMAPLCAQLRACVALLASGVIQGLSWAPPARGQAPADLAGAAAPLAWDAAAQQLAGARFAADLSQDTVGAYRFESGDTAILALWSTRGDTAAAVSTKDPKPSLVDVMGNAQECPTRDGVAVVPLDGFPCFLRQRRSARATLAPLWSGAGGVQILERGIASRVLLRLRNPFRRTEIAAVRAAGPHGWRVEVQRPDAGRHADEEIALVVTPPRDADAGAYTLDVATEFAGAGATDIRFQVPVQIGN